MTVHRSFLLLLGLVCCSLSLAASIKDGFFQTSDGIRLHYLEAGKGPAIVFIPGWTMPASIWKRQLEGLSAKYRVIALDPRSQNRTGGECLFGWQNHHNGPAQARCVTTVVR